MAPTRRKFSEYRKEAKTEPFVLIDDDGAEIALEYPDSEQLIELSELPQNQPRALLAKLCGDQYDKIWELVRHEPIDVLNALVQDITEHFGLRTAQDLPGGSKALSN
jgi:hypothetical protein